MCTVYGYFDTGGERGDKTAFLALFDLTYPSLLRWQREHQWTPIDFSAMGSDGKGRRFPREFRQAVATLYEHFDTYGKAGGKKTLLDLLGISSSLPYIWKKTVGAFADESAGPPENADDPQSQYAALLALEEETGDLDTLRQATAVSLLLEPHIARLRDAITQITTLHRTAHNLAERRGSRTKSSPKAQKYTASEALQEMDARSKLLCEHVAGTPAPGLLSPLIVRVQSAIAEVMRLTGTPPKEVKEEPPKDTPLPVPDREEPKDAAAHLSPTPPPDASQASPHPEALPPPEAPPHPLSSPPPSVPASLLPAERRSAAPTSRPEPISAPPARREVFVGFRNPERNPTTDWRFREEEERKAWQEAVTADRRECARRVAFMPWARKHFHKTLSIPSVEQRTRELTHAPEYEALAFEIARREKGLILPVLRDLRGSPVEKLLRDRGLSLIRLCIERLPHAIASFDALSNEGDGVAFERHIHTHLYAYIEQALLVGVDATDAE